MKRFLHIPQLRGYTGVAGQFNRSLKRYRFFDNVFKLTVSIFEPILRFDRIA